MSATSSTLAPGRTARRGEDPSPDARRAPTARPERVAPGRPPLEVVTERYRTPAARRRRRRLTGVGGVLAALAVVFGLVYVHVKLTANQLRLTTLQREGDVAEERYLKLRLQVAQLESPGRVEATAQQLGLVPPTSVAYLTASPPGGPSGPPTTTSAPSPSAPSPSAPSTSAPSTSAPSTSAPAALRGWAATKHVDTRR